MSYRYYIYEVDKSLVNKIRACQTKKDLISVISKDKPEAYEYYGDDEAYIQLYRLGKELFEFGSGYENASEMYKYGNSLFSSTELNGEFQDEQPIILKEDGLICAIEWQKNKIISFYEDLLQEKSNDSWDNRSQFDRMKSHVNDYLRWWKPEFGDYTAYNLDKNTDKLVQSWLYEHTIFDLVRIYKTFDWENKCMLLMGW